MPNNNPIHFIFIILAGLILPMVLIPVVALTGYSEVVEELVKALVVLVLISRLSSSKSKLIAAAIFGLLFGLSESMLYLNNILQIGDMSIFGQRLLYTMPMHMLTVLIITFSTLKKRWYILFGLVNAVILHSLFNQVVSWL